MRIRVSHETVYRYEQPAKNIAQMLRVTPRSHDGQQVSNWRLEIDVDGRLRAVEDEFGNLAHMVSIDGPVDSLTVTVTGDVETIDTHGVVSGAAERFVPSVFLRDTPFTEADEELRAFVDDAGRGTPDTLSLLHRLLSAIHRDVAFDTETARAGTTAREAFAKRQGVCQDLAHIFVAAARCRGVPARYVSGYFVCDDGAVAHSAGHAWAEALVPDLGWVGFDPANGISPTDAHVRVAIGLDSLGAAPFRGSRDGGGTERLDVTLRLAASMRQSQS